VPGHIPVRRHNNKSVTKTIQSLIIGKNPADVASNPSIVPVSTTVTPDTGGTPSTDSGTPTPYTGGGSTAVLSFLRGKTSNKAMIAGIMGNMQIESSFNPAALNAGEGAIGYIQWELGRRTALQAFARARGA